MVQARETETETAINDEIKSIEQRMDRLTEEHQAEVECYIHDLSIRLHSW